MTDTDPEPAKPRIRGEIARLRRRIDGRLRTAQHDGRRLLCWQTYVVRYPGYATLAALSAGAAVSSGLRVGWWRLLGRNLARRMGNKAAELAHDEFKAIWRDSTPGPDAASNQGQ